MASGCMTFSSVMFCAPAAAIAVAVPRGCTLSSSSAAAVNAKWGWTVSSKTTFMHTVLQRPRTASHVAFQVAVAQLTDFSSQESVKFREGLLQQLEANPTTASDKVKIADVCTKIFGDYLDEYDGSLSPKPFGEMKAALDSQNLPGTELVICAALGWSRGHLHHDWKMSQEK